MGEKKRRREMKRDSCGESGRKKDKNKDRWIEREVL